MPEEHKSTKYEYIPDVRLIMRRGGYDIDLIKILEEPINIPFIPENFMYIRGDINGRSHMMQQNNQMPPRAESKAYRRIKRKR